MPLSFHFFLTFITAKVLTLNPFCDFLCTVRWPLLLLVGQLILNFHLKLGFRAPSSRALSPKWTQLVFIQNIFLFFLINNYICKCNYYELSLIKSVYLHNFKQHLFGEGIFGDVIYFPFQKSYAETVLEHFLNVRSFFNNDGFFFMG